MPLLAGWAAHTKLSLVHCHLQLAMLQAPGKEQASSEVGFQDEEEDDEEPVLLCARCYSLQHYGSALKTMPQDEET